MRTSALLTFLLVAAPLSAKPPEPVVELHVRSLDGFLALADYFAGLSDKPEMGQQVVALANAFTKQKTGLEGVDRTRPIGAYATLTEGGQPAAAVLVPIKDQKAFLNLLEKRLSAKLVDNDGVYTVNVPNVPVALFLTFHADYAYIAPSAAWVGDDSRAEPSAFFATPLAPNSLASLAVRLDRVSPDVKKTVIAQAELKTGDDIKKGAKPGEKAGAAALRQFTAKKVVSAFAAVAKEGETLSADFAVDPQTDTVSLVARVVPKAGTPMAAYVQSLGSLKGHTLPALATDAGTARVNFALPKSAAQEWGQVVDAIIKDALDAPGDPAEAALRITLAESLRPTAEAGVFDAALAFGGPDVRRVAAVVGLTGGEEVEAAARSILPFMPAKDGKVKLDAAKLGRANLHLLTLTDPEADLGSGGQFWLATATDRLVVVSGKTSDAAATVATANTAPGPLLEARLFPAAILTFNEGKDADAARSAAEKVYGDKPVAGRDEFKLRLTGGDSLDLALSVKGKALAFAAAFSQALKGE